MLTPPAEAYLSMTIIITNVEQENIHLSWLQM